MNILEDQVTDLNYLTESPIALSASMNGQRASSSAESPADTEVGSKKRKSEETNGNSNSAAHTRAKRNRYISIAWYVILRCLCSSKDRLSAPNPRQHNLSKLLGGIYRKGLQKIPVRLKNHTACQYATVSELELC